MRDRDFEIRAGIDFDAHQKCGAASAKILAGCIFFKEMATAVAPAHLHGKMHGNPTLRSLPGNLGCDRGHG